MNDSENRDAQITYMQSKIESIKIHITDIEEYFETNKHDLVDGDGQRQKDNQVYWSKKLEQLNKKIVAMPN